MTTMVSIPVTIMVLNLPAHHIRDGKPDFAIYNLWKTIPMHQLLGRLSIIGLLKAVVIGAVWD